MEKNLGLKYFRRKYAEYLADEESFIVYCQTEIDCSEEKHRRKLKNYDDCYLMDRVGYESFVLEGKRHRSCFVYIGDWNTSHPWRSYIHPCILIVRLDKASTNYESVMLTEEQDLSQFIGENQSHHKEVNLYTLFLEDSSTYQDQTENDEIILNEEDL